MNSRVLPLAMAALLAGGAWAGRVEAVLNPLSPGLPVIASVLGVTNVANNNLSAMCVACHTTSPVQGGSTHFIAQNGRFSNYPIVTTPGTHQRFEVWGKPSSPSPLLKTGRSKYGDFTLKLSVTNPASNKELICESCHNINTNVAGGNNLLEYSNHLIDVRPPQPSTLTQDSTSLCEGCHISTMLPGHHPMSGDTMTDTTPFTTAGNDFTRAYVNPTTQMQMPPGSVSQVYYSPPDRMGCLSCHADGHDGANGTGARILLKGYAGPTSVAPVAPGSAVVGNTASPIARQADTDLFLDTSPPTRLIPNWQPLCDACHKVND